MASTVDDRLQLKIFQYGARKKKLVKFFRHLKMC